MARPFKNSSSANKAFGVFSESNTAGDYINNKKTTARAPAPPLGPLLKFMIIFVFSFADWVSLIAPNATSLLEPRHLMKLLQR